MYQHSAHGSSLEMVWSSPITIDKELDSYAQLSKSATQPEFTMNKLDYEGGIVEHVVAPTKVFVRSALHGEMLLDQLDETTTVASIKETIASRVMLQPTRHIHLESWGVELQDHFTLRDYRLNDNCLLHMRTSLGPKRTESSREVLERVRISSTALETQLYAVDHLSTANDLKQKVAAYLASGTYEWYNKKGEHISAQGTTLLAISAVKADEKTGTSEIRQGEQLISTVPLTGEGKGKAINVIRARKGTPAVVMDNNVVPLQLEPEKQRLSFRARDLQDDVTLWDAGVRHDDVIMLEFVSPVTPAPLQVLRAPEKPKGEKKGKGGKKNK
jgi:hypothetical protein